MPVVGFIERMYQTQQCLVVSWGMPMSLAALIDDNAPIYAAGRMHSLKEPCIKALLLASEHPPAFVTDDQFLPELLHRYLSFKLRPLGCEAFLRFSQLMEDWIETVQVQDLQRAAAPADAHQELVSRGLLRSAVMEHPGLRRIISADSSGSRSWTSLGSPIGSPLCYGARAGGWPMAPLGQPRIQR